jgi:hypothetical protein
MHSLCIFKMVDLSGQRLMKLSITQLIDPFLRDQGLRLGDVEICQLPADGSTRMFWRISALKRKFSFVVMFNPPVNRFTDRENNAYLFLGRHLKRRGMPVPEIYRSDLKTGWFIMEDVGRMSLQDAVLRTDDPIPLYQEVIDILLRLQIWGVRGFQTSWCCQTERYDKTVMRRLESYYFREAFLIKYLNLEGERLELNASFEHLAEKASKMDAFYLLHRDFQSRNIMISEGRISVIDWQGGRLGPLAYDLASLINDPYTDLARPAREHLLGYYLNSLQGYDSKATHGFLEHFPYVAIQRNLQVLGAFGFLTVVGGKRHFAQYIPKALQTLHSLLESLDDPELDQLRTIVVSVGKNLKGEGPGKHF